MLEQYRKHLSFRVNSTRGPRLNFIIFFRVEEIPKDKIFNVADVYLLSNSFFL